jgi:hypothetical protein
MMDCHVDVHIFFPHYQLDEINEFSFFQTGLTVISRGSSSNQLLARTNGFSTHRVENLGLKKLSSKQFAG